MLYPSVHDASSQPVQKACYPHNSALQPLCGSLSDRQYRLQAIVHKGNLLYVTVSHIDFLACLISGVAPMVSEKFTSKRQSPFSLAETQRQLEGILKHPEFAVILRLADTKNGERIWVGQYNHLSLPKNGC